VSSLWTPEGEHRVRPAGGDGGASGGSRGGPGADPEGADDVDLEDIDDLDDLGPEERAELAGRLDELRRQLLGTPAEIVVANHAYGLFELAAIHLSQQPPRRDEARLAVDAMAALVEGLAGRLGDAERSLQDALAQIRLAFVQINEAAAATGGEAGGTGDPAP
jgi:hypothetical protein